MSKSSTTFTKNFRRKHRRPICRESVSLDKNRGASYVCKKASSTRKRGRSSKKPSKTHSKNNSGIAFRRSRFGTDFGTKIHGKSLKIAPKSTLSTNFGRLGPLRARFSPPGVDLARSKRLGRARSSELGSLGSPKVAPACARVRHAPLRPYANSGIDL